MKPFDIVEVRVPVTEEQVQMAVLWCKRQGKRPNRRNVAEMLRSWCDEGLRDFATDPNRNDRDDESHRW